MKCSFNQNLLHEYLDHELDPLLEIILEEHLAICPECNKELNQLKVLDWDLRNTAKTEIPEEMLKAIRTMALDRCFPADENEAQSSLLDIYRIQSRAAGYALNYVQYIPGADLLKKTGQASVQYLGKKLNPGRLFLTGRRG